MAIAVREDGDAEMSVVFVDDKTTRTYTQLHLHTTLRSQDSNGSMGSSSPWCVTSVK